MKSRKRLVRDVFDILPTLTCRSCLWCHRSRLLATTGKHLRSCFRDFQTAVNCYQDFQTAVNCYQDFQTAVNCYQDFQTAVNCYQDFQTAVNCYQDFQTAIICYEEFKQQLTVIKQDEKSTESCWVYIFSHLSYGCHWCFYGSPPLYDGIYYITLFQVILGLL